MEDKILREKERDRIYQKKYYELNKEKCKEYNKKMFTCECGKTFQSCKKKQHNLTKKHNEYINNKI